MPTAPVESRWDRAGNSMDSGRTVQQFLSAGRPDSAGDSWLTRPGLVEADSCRPGRDRVFPRRSPGRLHAVFPAPRFSSRSSFRLRYDCAGYCRRVCQLPSSRTVKKVVLHGIDRQGAGRRWACAASSQRRKSACGLSSHDGVGAHPRARAGPRRT